MMKRIGIGVLVLVVLVGVAGIVLDRTLFASVAVNTSAPAAPTLTAPTQTTARLYRIDPAQSEVRYEVGETFFRENRFSTAIGRTRGIAGDILVDLTQPSRSQVGDLVIDISQFTSDQQRRDNYIRNNNLESVRYPLARFQTRSVSGLPDQVAVGDQVSVSIAGDLTVKQTTQPVMWNMALRLEEGQLVGTASTEILMSQFGIGPIRLAVLATEDLVRLYFNFVARPA